MTLRFVAYMLRNTLRNYKTEKAKRFPVWTATSPSVSLNVRVPVTQRSRLSIVSILSAYDDLIENNRRRVALLEEAARLLYREWFVHFRFPRYEHVKVTDGLPEGWSKHPVLVTLADSLSRQIATGVLSLWTPMAIGR